MASGIKREHAGEEDSTLLIDATMKAPMPPLALPGREYMEGARVLWDKLGLPKLKPQRPWYGYDMGEWNEDLETMARRAVQGDYWQTGEIIAQRRRSDVEMNTEVRTLAEGTPGAGDSKDKGDLSWDGLSEAAQPLSVESKE